VSGWQPDGTGIVSNGDCGGDIQRGDSYSVRYRHPQLPHAVITRSAYAAEDTDRNPGEFFVQVETEWIVCTDPADPGGTETWSDTSYDDEEDRSWDTAEEAEADARRVAAELLQDAGSHSWDGRPEVAR
jgi:hypothetical protein